MSRMLQGNLHLFFLLTKEVIITMNIGLKNYTIKAMITYCPTLIQLSFLKKYYSFAFAPKAFTKYTQRYTAL